jgi:hypothetical protein
MWSTVGLFTLFRPVPEQEEIHGGLKKFRVFCISDFAVGDGMSKPDIKEARLQGLENDSHSLRIRHLDISKYMRILAVSKHLLEPFNFKMTANGNTKVDAS